jgi:hypothetical protein
VLFWTVWEEVVQAMAERRPISPEEALDRLFMLIREQASQDRQFGRRLLEAVGVTVIYRGDDAFDAVDPVLLAADGREAFEKTLNSFRVADLKALIKSFDLATAADMKGRKKKADLIELMWQGAKGKRDDTVPRWWR